MYFCGNPGVKAVTSGASSSNFLEGVIPTCTVTIYLTGTITKATIYSDSSNTPRTNPFTANTNGSIQPTWAATGQAYDVVLSGGIPPNTYANVVTLTGLGAGGGGGGGGVTSVGLSVTGPLYTVSGSPITSAGTLTETLNTQGENLVFAGPCGGGGGLPVFRTICSSDLPTGSGPYVLLNPAASQTQTQPKNTVMNTITSGSGAIKNNGANVITTCGPGCTMNVLSDSLAFGNRVNSGQGFVDWLAANLIFANGTVVNNAATGMSSASCANIDTNWTSLGVPYTPNGTTILSSYLFLSCGHNDITNGDAPATVFGHIQSIVNKAKVLGIVPIVDMEYYSALTPIGTQANPAWFPADLDSTCVSTSSWAGSGASFIDDLYQLNQLVLNTLQSQAGVFILPTSGNFQNSLSPSDTCDGTHATGGWNHKWASFFAQQFSKGFPLEKSYNYTPTFPIYQALGVGQATTPFGAAYLPWSVSSNGDETLQGGTFRSENSGGSLLGVIVAGQDEMQGFTALGSGCSGYQANTTCMEAGGFFDSMGASTGLFGAFTFRGVAPGGGTNQTSLSSDATGHWGFLNAPSAPTFILNSWHSALCLATDSSGDAQAGCQLGGLNGGTAPTSQTYNWNNNVFTNVGGIAVTGGSPGASANEATIQFVGAFAKYGSLGANTTTKGRFQFVNSVSDNSSSIIGLQDDGAGTWSALTAFSAPAFTLTNATSGSQSIASPTGALGTRTYTVPLPATGSTDTFCMASGAGGGDCSAGAIGAALTMNNSGSGAASGTTFDGSTARTISYNTIGASPLAGSTSLVTVGTIATGTWQGTIIGAGYGGLGLNTALATGCPQDASGMWSIVPCSGSGGINQLTGDVTAGSGVGSQVATLATVNSSPGTCGDATHVCAITTNAKGLTTAQTATAITFPSSGLSGMTSGQVALAGSATTITSSIPLASGGSSVTTGPTTVTSGHIPKFASTTGNLADGYGITGSASVLATQSGSIASGDFASSDGSGNLNDSGVAASSVRIPATGTAAGVSGTVYNVYTIPTPASNTVVEYMATLTLNGTASPYASQATITCSGGDCLINTIPGATTSITLSGFVLQVSQTIPASTFPIQWTIVRIQ